MPSRNSIIVMAAIAGAGLLFLIANIDLPIVRNSFVYAKAAKNIIEQDLNPLPVIADTNLSHGKAIGFSLLSVPFVSIFGVNAGMKIASFLGTVFLLWIAYFFLVRLNRRTGIDSRFIPLELGLLFFNPLMFYQFWSAYPDSLFAGEVLLAFVLSDIIIVEHKRDTRAHILLLGLVIYAAIHTRYYGMILGIAVPIYLLTHLRPFLERATHVRTKVTLLVLVFLGLGVAVVLARLGMNPTLNFAVDARLGGGYSGYVKGLTDPSWKVLSASMIMFVFALVLNFHFSLIFLLKGKRSKRGRRWYWPTAPACFAGIYVLGLLLFPGTSYNMRFFLPIYAFVVVAIVNGMQRMDNKARWGIVAAYVFAASFITLNYNLQPLNRRLATFNEKFSESILNKPRRLDNLRLNRQMSFSGWINRINDAVEPGEVLYYASTYYGTAMHGLVEDLGIRNDIDMRYVSTPSEIPTSEKAVYLAGRWFGDGLSELEDDFTITSVEGIALRLVPLRVEMTEPWQDSFEEGEVLTLKTMVSTTFGAEVSQVEFLIDSIAVAIDSASPYEFNWRGADKGRYVLNARAHDGHGNIALSHPVTVFVGILAMERKIASSSDDAEEQVDGSMYLSSSDLELIAQSDIGIEEGDQIVGMRFTNIQIPREAEIMEAYIQFTVDEVSTAPTALTIQAELSGNAAAFTKDTHDISSRRRTSVVVRWTPQAWDVIGERSMKQRTPDISALIAEVTAQPDWQAGHAMVFIIGGSGARVAESYEGQRESMPLLYIERR